MIATMLCIVPTAVSAGDVSVGGVADGYTPEGTAITNAEEFAAMTAGGKYYLANDITITATWNAGAERPALAENATAFAGTLDGNGKTITTSVALFANIAGSTVKNLTVAGDVAAIDTDHNSAIGCWTNGEVNFENVCNKANVLGGKSAGAFIGYGKTGTILNIKNCVNNGNITGSSQVGGLAGYIQDDVVVIENCENNGVVTSTASYGAGIIGRFGRDAADADSKITITNCVNNGAVNTNGAQAGGMLGYALGRVVIENCENNGAITNKDAAAGIFGILGDKVASTYSLLIKNCVNNGVITGNVAVGGIVARHGRNASIDTYRVENCVNNGDVHLRVYQPTKAVTVYVGGIAGYAWGGADCGIVNSINNGDVYVENIENPAFAVTLYAAGLVGYINGTDWVAQNCINTGEMKLTGPAPIVTTLTVYNKNAAPTPGKIANNYALACGEIGAGHVGDPAADPSTLVVAGESYAKTVTAEQVASGELAYLVNEGAGAKIYFQNIGEDAVPVLDATHKEVIKNADGTYANPSVNLNTINPLIETALALTEADYTPETWAPLKTALESAQAAVAAETPDQTAIDVAAAALDAAIKALVEVAPTTPIIDIGGTTYTTVAAALEALTDGATLKLLEDITLEATLELTKSVTLDGNGKTLTAMGFNAVNVVGNSITVTVKNLKIVTDKIGINAPACSGEDTRSTLNVSDCTINATGTAKANAGINFLAYWNVNVTNCTITSANRGIFADGDGRNKTVIKGCTITADTANGYAVYVQEGSTVEVSDTTMTSNTNTTFQSITAEKGLGSTVTLKNVTATATGAYCVAVNPNNTYYIEGGTYKASAKDAAINVHGYGAYAKVYGDIYVECSQNCAIRVYVSGDAAKYGQDGKTVLDIESGTFVYNNPEGNAGSALRAGTGSAGGIANIKGGTFITNGSGPVLNLVHADGEINVMGGTFENNGTSTINILSKMYDGAEDTTNGAAFPDGAKKAEFKDGAYKAIVESSDVTTVPGGSNETTGPDDGDDTTSPDNNDTTTTQKPDEGTTEKPADTDPPKKKNCGGFAVTAQIITILGAAVTLVIVKKKH